MLIHHPTCQSGWPFKNIVDGDPAKGVERIPGRLPLEWDPVPYRRGTWKALEELQADGRVEKIGVCNFGIQQMTQLMVVGGGNQRTQLTADQRTQLMVVGGGNQRTQAVY